MRISNRVNRTDKVSFTILISNNIQNTNLSSSCVIHFQVKTRIPVQHFFQSLDILGRQTKVTTSTPSLKGSQKTRSIVSFYQQLNSHHWMVELLDDLRCLLYTTYDNSCLSSLWLNRHLRHISIITKVSLQDRRTKRQTFLPCYFDCTQLFIKLFWIHLVLNLSSQILSFFFLFFHSLKEFFSSSQFCCQIFLSLSFFFLSPFQIFDQYLSLLIHLLNSLFFLGHSLDMNGIELPVFILLQKFIGPADLNEDSSGFFLFISIRMILQSKGSVLLLDLCKIFSGITVQQFVRVFFELKLLQSFLESLHLLQVFIFQHKMALNQWYNDVVSYWWPNQSSQKSQQQAQSETMPVLSRLKRLRNIMKDSNYSEHIKEQICNFYSQLIKQYPWAKSTFRYPNFLYEPSIYKPKICFEIKLKINLPQTKGALELFIMFPEELPSEMPSFFLKNPNYSLFKPNKKHVIFCLKNDETTRFYEAVMGGVKVLMPIISNQRWQWTPSQYYKEQNILNMVRWIHKQLVLDYFPFVKRKKQKIDLVQAQAKQLKGFLQKTVMPTEENVIEIPLLANIQSLSALQQTISLQISTIYQEIESLKKIQVESVNWNIKEFLPEPSDRRSQLLIDSVSSLEALKDTVSLLQNKFYQNQIGLSQFLKLGQSIFRQEFDERSKINFWETPQIL